MKKIFTYLILIFVVSSCAPAAVATRPSPPANVVVRPPSPAPGYVWVNDRWHYTRNAKAYQYRNGYWARPRKRGATWVEGAWVENRRGWHYSKGHWH